MLGASRIFPAPPGVAPLGQQALELPEAAQDRVLDVLPAVPE